MNLNNKDDILKFKLAICFYKIFLRNSWLIEDTFLLFMIEYVKRFTLFIESNQFDITNACAHLFLMWAVAQLCVNTPLVFAIYVEAAYWNINLICRFKAKRAFSLCITLYVSNKTVAWRGILYFSLDLFRGNYELSFIIIWLAELFVGNEKLLMKW